VSTGRHHVVVHIPGHPAVWADYREPVVPAMRRWNRLVVSEHKPPRPSDVQAILSWYAENAVMSANCQRGVCAHEVV
jgi:hypothetical protein